MTVEAGMDGNVTKMTAAASQMMTVRGWDQISGVRYQGGGDNPSFFTTAVKRDHVGHGPCATSPLLITFGVDVPVSPMSATAIPGHLRNTHTNKLRKMPS